MRGLYAIVDAGALAARDLDVVAFAEAVLDARPAAVQLRDKHGGARTVLDRLRVVAPIAARAGVPLFANDRPDLAVLAGCDGVHVGQDDLPVGHARELARRAGHPLRIGLSTHDAVQIEAALADRPDYVAVGPIFATTSKDRPDPVVGLDRLAVHVRRVRERAPALPVVAIGGITMESAGAVGAIADAVAVIGALLPEGRGARAFDEVRARARAIHAAVLEARGGVGAR